VILEGADGRPTAETIYVQVRQSTLRLMPRYEFRCRDCSTTFELSRPMSASRDPARCPSGHDDTVRLLSTVALSGGSRPGSASVRSAAPAGGCCGGGCCS
jgi:putative FmdB family regulatory protein